MDLTPLRKLTNLKSLFMFSSKVSESQKALLRKAIPGLKINRP